MALQSSPCDFGHRVGETTAVLPGERWCSGNSRGGHLWSARIVTVGWRVPIYSGIYTIYIIYSPDTIYIYSPDIPYHFIPIYNYIQYMIYVPMVSTFFRTSWTLPQWWSMHDVSATLGVSTKKCFFGVHTNVRHLRSAVLKVEQHQGYQVTTVYHPVPAIGALGPWKC